MPNNDSKLACAPPHAQAAVTPDSSHVSAADVLVASAYLGALRTPEEMRAARTHLRPEVISALARRQSQTPLNGVLRDDSKLLELLARAVELVHAQRDWIMAVPAQTPLPAMPGFDREDADSVLEDLEVAVLTLASRRPGGVASPAKLRAAILALACDDARANDEYSDRRSAFHSGHDVAKLASAALVMGDPE